MRKQGIQTPARNAPSDAMLEKILAPDEDYAAIAETKAAQAGESWLSMDEAEGYLECSPSLYPIWLKEKEAGEAAYWLETAHKVCLFHDRQLSMKSPGYQKWRVASCLARLIKDRPDIERTGLNVAFARSMSIPANSPVKLSVHASFDWDYFPFRKGIGVIWYEHPKRYVFRAST
ncbi:MAG: hypothetical protein LBS65_05285 [Desulfovibrio sp.]|jgi:hypothetical protein|nr:hypothetical protein [Desulfovibrio sp.]